MAGIVPMVASAAAIFWPWGEPGSRASFVALALLLAAYCVAFTAYVGPYLALLPELARSEDERGGELAG